MEPMGRPNLYQLCKVARTRIVTRRRLAPRNSDAGMLYILVTGKGLGFRNLVTV